MKKTQNDSHKNVSLLTELSVVQPRQKKRSSFWSRLDLRASLLLALPLFFLLGNLQAPPSEPAQVSFLPPPDGDAGFFFVVQDAIAPTPEIHAEYYDGKVFVPVHFFAQYMGISYQTSGDTLKLQRGKDKLIINLSDSSMLQHKDGRQMLAFRAVSEHFGFAVTSLNNGIILRAKNESATLLDEEITAKYANYVASHIAAPSGKTVFLTFDDGPAPATAEILDILHENNILATFFCLGGPMESRPETLKRILRENHSVGLHGTSHKKDEFYKSPDASLWEMNVANDILFETTGVRSHIIRTPFGSVPHLTAEHFAMLEGAGYKVWDWNVDSEDTVNTSSIAATTIKQIQSAKGDCVILLHDKPATVNALPEIISHLKANGYVFKPITDDVPPRNYLNKKL